MYRIFAFYGYIDFNCLDGCLSMISGHMLFWVSYMLVVFFFLFVLVQRN